MIIKTNLAEYRKKKSADIANLRKGKINTHRKAAQLMMLEAKRMAPKRSGALIAGIRARYYANSSRVTSTVPKDFPYNLWVNETPPFTKIKLIWRYLPRGVVPGTPMAYREMPGRTGVPGYFDLAAELVAKRYKSIALESVRGALKARID
jgi:hypothetical protein